MAEPQFQTHPEPIALPATPTPAPVPAKASALQRNERTTGCSSDRGR